MSQVSFSQDIPSPQLYVTRRRYEREKKARQLAEGLLEAKSRELYEMNQKLREQAKALEKAVYERTREAEIAADARTVAEASNAAKSRFLASMSHEIRTPLHGMLGMVIALDGTELDEEQRDFVDTLKDAGCQLRGVVNDILDLSKIEAGQFHLAPVRFYLPTLLSSLRQHYRLIAAAKGLTLAFDPKSCTEKWVYADELRLKQVLGNLLSNAIKFTEHGCVSLTVSMEENEGDEGLLRITVTDTGVGIGKEALAQIFTPFAQADAQVAHKFGGSGLGLAISREICEQMGGHLSLESEEGRGTVARANVRAMRVSPPQDMAVNTDQETAEALLRSRRWRILIVDDSAINRKVVAQFLKKYGVEIIEAKDGSDGVDLWRKTRPDFIFMDINMPVMGGIAAAMMIRHETEALRARRVPIVALTANAMSHQVHDYLEAGLDAHVAKPVSRTELVSIMGQFLQ